VLNTFMGSIVAALAESMALAQKAEVNPQHLLEVIQSGALNAPLFTIKVRHWWRGIGLGFGGLVQGQEAILDCWIPV
jgi:3-hydroxyisobutyrate dehydrogenase-like beta-hydroxyacid dehydrogenase